MQDVEASKDEQAKLAALANTLKGLRDDAVKPAQPLGLKQSGLKTRNTMRGLTGLIVTNGTSNQPRWMDE